MGSTPGMTKQPTEPRRQFSSRAEIINVVTKHRRFDSSREELLNAQTLEIFRSQNQHTWLVATSEKLYLILDDVRRAPRQIPNWAIDRENIVGPGGEIALPITATESTNQRIRDRIGLVHIGPNHQDWLYTKRLFGNVGIAESIRGLLRNAMLESPTTTVKSPPPF